MKTKKVIKIAKAAITVLGAVVTALADVERGNG